MPDEARRFPVRRVLPPVAGILLTLLASPALARDAAEPKLAVARLAAIGSAMPGLAAAGYFHRRESASRDAALRTLTSRGEILDPTRILVLDAGFIRSVGSQPASSGAGADGVTDVLASGETDSLYRFQKRQWPGLTGIVTDNAAAALWITSTRGEARCRLTGTMGGGLELRLCEGAVAAAPLGAIGDKTAASTGLVTKEGGLAIATLDGPARPILPNAAISLNTPCASRTGLIFNWYGAPALFAANPGRNEILAISLTAGTAAETGAIRALRAGELDCPVALAPAKPEAADKAHSANTTLSPGSDFYVLNRGNGTILLMSQEGLILGQRRLAMPSGSAIGGGRVTGLAVSPDGERIWITANGPLPDHPGRQGALLEIPAFGPDVAGASAMETAGAAGKLGQGAALFSFQFSLDTGIGPLFNARSCAECHQDPGPGGMGIHGLALAERIGRREGGLFSALIGSGGPVARSRSAAEFGLGCVLQTGPPEAANIVSPRNTPPLFGLGAIEAIPDKVIEAQARKRAVLGGRPNKVEDSNGAARVGRFGWKAGSASLLQFTAEAFRDELGIENVLAAPARPVNFACEGLAVSPLPRETIESVAAFVASLPPPLPRPSPDPIGRIMFSAAGCSGCHVPSLPGRNGPVALYSDLLLHAMGPGLDDGIEQGDARGPDWRTAPLWGLGMRKRFLHDGRATVLQEAIAAHGGESSEAAKAFEHMTRAEQDALLSFLLAL